LTEENTHTRELLLKHSHLGEVFVDPDDLERSPRGAGLLELLTREAKCRLALIL
jgi:hypothetical protein